jgi:hypothetical protein
MPIMSATASVTAVVAVTVAPSSRRSDAEAAPLDCVIEAINPYTHTSYQLAGTSDLYNYRSDSFCQSGPHCVADAQRHTIRLQPFTTEGQRES